jgi:potassium voltage-gated channel Shal-related subfamily D protein 2
MGSYAPLHTSRADIQSQSRDLSNRKLAQNQTELSRQIHGLATTIEQQGKLLRKLLKNIEPQEESDDRQA